MTEQKEQGNPILISDGSHEVLHTHLGGLTDTQAFLDLLVEAYRVKREDLLIKEAASSFNEPR